MTFSQILNNIFYEVKMNIVKHAYIYSPIIGIAIYTALLQNRNLDNTFTSNIINLSGILAGFLFTSLGIMIALPDNKFTTLLKENGYMKIIYKTMTIGIISFLISMIIGLFSFSTSIMTILFIIGVSETFLSSYYIYRVSYFTSKSI